MNLLAIPSTCSGTFESTQKSPLSISARRLQVVAASVRYILPEWDRFIRYELDDSIAAVQVRNLVSQLAAAQLPGPGAAAMSDEGAISLYWENEQHYFMIRLGPNEKWQWMAFDYSGHSARRHFEGSGKLGLSGELRSLILRASPRPAHTPERIAFTT